MDEFGKLLRKWIAADAKTPAADEFGKLLQKWVAADTKAVSAEKRITESRLHGQEPSTALIREAEDLRAIADAARQKVANFVLTDPDATDDGQG